MSLGGAQPKQEPGGLKLPCTPTMCGLLSQHNKQRVLLSTMGLARLVNILLITDSRMPPRKRMRV